MEDGFDVGQTGQIQIPSFHDEAFLRRVWQVCVLPMSNSQSFLEIFLKKKPQSVNWPADIVEDSIVSLLP